jgi:AraC family transcriptional regulator
MISSVEAYRYLRATMTECSQKAGWRSLLLRAYDDPPVVEPFTTPPTQDHLIVLVADFPRMPNALSYDDSLLQQVILGVAIKLREGAPETYAESAAQFLTMHMLVLHGGHEITKARTRDEARMQRVCDYMHAHLAEEVSLQDLAQVAYVSRFHLIRMFKQTYGETPYQRLTRLRIQRAQRLLATSDTPIMQIALDCGITNQSNFAAAFRRLVGLSPRAYRQSINAPESS